MRKKTRISTGLPFGVLRLAMQLPEAFIELMQALFSAYEMRSDWPAFLASFEQDPARAYRFNALKIADRGAFITLHERLLKDSAAYFGKTNTAEVESVPWTNDGLYLPVDFQPGKSIPYRAVLFYIQEASAMLPAQALSAKPGEAILDLCAAPGGKSARIAADLQGHGVLWSNDINAQRAKVLLRNLEQLGVSNAIVTVAEPAALAAALPASFDRILIDAPCSGEGMFRRDPGAAVAWANYSNAHLLEIQAGLLASAVRLLKPGGHIVYSTCTFNRSENEAQIEQFLANYPDFETVDIRPLLPSDAGVSPALFAHHGLRIWPHQAKGDGHFVCLLKHRPNVNMLDSDETMVMQPATTSLSKQDEKALDAARVAFLAMSRTFLSDAYYEILSALPLRQWRLEKGRLHLLPNTTFNYKIAAVKFLKTGCFLAEMKETAKGFVVKPSHSFLITLRAEDLSYALNLSAEDERVQQYLRGETLSVTDAEASAWPAPKGELWLPILWQKQPLGWGKRQGNTVKNLFPAGWRTTY